MHPARPSHPTTVPVAITASTGIKLRHRRATMMAEFAPGHVVELRPGPNHFQLLPGHHRVQLWSQYAWRCGRATLDIDTTRGPVHLYYAAPYTIHSRGAAGFVPQERPGMRAKIAIFATAILVPLLIVAVALLQR